MQMNAYRLISSGTLEKQPGRYPANIRVRDNDGYLIHTFTAVSAAHEAKLLEGLPEGWRAERDGMSCR